MSVTSYGKCQHCGKHEILVGFWYNGESTVPDYLCPECMNEFDKAMESYRDYPSTDEYGDWKY